MVEIRTVEDKDIPVIYSLGANIEEFRTSNQAPTFWPETILKDFVDKKDVYFFVATSNDDIIGFIIANLNRSLSKVLIENIFVKPNFRGQGIGTSLIKKIITTARNDHYEFITVLTPPNDTPAIKAYEKAGFSQGETFLWLDM